MSKLELLIESYNCGEMTSRELALQIKRLTFDLAIDALEKSHNDPYRAFVSLGEKVEAL
jgi:hypothetical protein